MLAELVVAFALVAGTGIGWWFGTRRTLMRLGPWNGLRLMKRSGDPLTGACVETRDAGRASRLSRRVYGREFRYIVRRFDEAGQITDDLRYTDPYAALDMHARLEQKPVQEGNGAAARLDS